MEESKVRGAMGTMSLQDCAEMSTRDSSRLISRLTCGLLDSNQCLGHSLAVATTLSASGAFRCKDRGRPDRFGRSGDVHL
jgi:hypothetical protein